MLLESLEDKLKKEGTYEEFSKLIKSIKKGDRKDSKEYAKLITYMAALANDLDNFEVDDYAFIGGYATLMHVVNHQGIKSIGTWRGSHDLDVVSFDKRIEKLIETYSSQDLVKGNLPRKSHLSQKGMDKYNIKIETGKPKKQVKTDLYLVTENEGKIEDFTVGDEFKESIENVDFYGIPIRVPSKIQLINSKLSVKGRNGLLREKDITDVLRLIHSLEHEGKEINEIYDSIRNEYKPMFKNQIVPIMPHADKKSVVNYIDTKPQ